MNSQVKDDNERLFLWLTFREISFRRDSNGLNRVEGLDKDKRIDWILEYFKWKDSSI